MVTVTCYLRPMVLAHESMSIIQHVTNDFRHLIGLVENHHAGI